MATGGAALGSDDVWRERALLREKTTEAGVSLVFHRPEKQCAGVFPLFPAPAAAAGSARPRVKYGCLHCAGCMIRVRRSPRCVSLSLSPQHPHRRCRSLSWAGQSRSYLSGEAQIGLRLSSAGSRSRARQRRRVMRRAHCGVRCWQSARRWVRDWQSRGRRRC